MSPQPRATAAVRARLAITAISISLVLAACATGSAAGPSEAMDARLAQGTTVAVTLDADPDAIADPAAAAQVEDALAAQADGPLMTMAIDPDGAVTGMSLADAVFVRRAGNDVYLRVDWTRLDDMEGAPLPQDPRDALDELGMSGDAGDLSTALAAGEWVGITDISDSAQNLVGSLLGPSEAPMLPDPSNEEVQALLEEQHLDSVDAFLTNYVTATGDNPWELTIDGAAVQQALEDVEAGANEAGVSSDMQLGNKDMSLPDTITGLTLTAQDGVATELRIDLDEFMSSVGGATLGNEDLAELAELSEADPTLIVTMTDLGDNAGPPADATTISLSDLMTMMGEEG